MKQDVGYKYFSLYRSLDFVTNTNTKENLRMHLVTWFNFIPNMDK